MRRSVDEVYLKPILDEINGDCSLSIDVSSTFVFSSQNFLGASLLLFRFSKQNPA